MKADATAENRPAYLVIGGDQDALFGPTHEYQARIEVIVVFLMEIAIVLVRLFSELFMKPCAWILFLLDEIQFQSCCHSLKQPIRIVSHEQNQRVDL